MDASGALKESLYYEPFGRRTDALGKPLASGALDILSGFTGHEHDDDLGLINMRGRIYDPTLRRFLSADPHVTDPLSGQSYNRYSYVVNNPTNLVDPTGLDWWDGSGGDWGSGGCIGQECAGGSGVEFSSGGFESNQGGGYSWTPSTGTPSGTSGSAVAGGGYGGPVQASENHRQRSMPTGPAAPAAVISGPVVKVGTGGGNESMFAGGDATIDVPPPVPFMTTMGAAAWNLKAFHDGDISPAGVVVSTVRGVYDDVVVPVKDWAVDMQGDGRHRDHSEAMSVALGTLVLTAIMPGGATAAEAVPAITKGSQVAPPIHVDAGMIVDGNHRYVAGRVLGLEPDGRRASTPRSRG